MNESEITAKKTQHNSDESTSMYCFISFPKSKPTHAVYRSLSFTHTLSAHLALNIFEYIQIKLCVHRRSVWLCVSLREGSVCYCGKCIPEFVSVKHNKYTLRPNCCSLLTHLLWTGHTKNGIETTISVCSHSISHRVYFLFLFLVLQIWINKNVETPRTISQCILLFQKPFCLWFEKNCF